MKHLVLLGSLLFALLVARSGEAADVAPHRATGLQSVVVASGLDSPRGMAFGPGGELYVADSGSTTRPGSGQVVRFDP